MECGDCPRFWHRPIFFGQLAATIIKCPATRKASSSLRSSINEDGGDESRGCTTSQLLLNGNSLCSQCGQSSVVAADWLPGWCSRPGKGCSTSTVSSRSSC